MGKRIIIKNGNFKYSINLDKIEELERINTIYGYIRINEKDKNTQFNTTVLYSPLGGTMRCKVIQKIPLIYSILVSDEYYEDIDSLYNAYINNKLKTFFTEYTYTKNNLTYEYNQIYGSYYYIIDIWYKNKANFEFIYE